MSNLKITRKFGERRPVRIKVTYPTSYDLSAADVYFWLDAPDGTPQIEGAAAEAEDITPVGATTQTVWLLTYTFALGDLPVIGVYFGEFEVDFGGDFREYYPIGKDRIQVTVLEHPASTP